MTDSRTGTLYALGLGPGDPGLVTMRAVEILRSGPVVAYPLDADGGPGRAFRIAEGYLDADVESLPLHMPMTTDSDALTEAWDAAVSVISRVTEAGRDVAYICLGDALLYGSFGYLLSRYSGPVNVVPGVISPVAAAAALKIPLVEGREPLTIVPDGGDLALLEGALALGGTVVIMKPSRLRAEGAALLARAGALGRAWVLEDVTLPGQRVYPAGSVDTLTALPYFSVVTVLAPGRALDRSGKEGEGA
ncbi:MAG: precorrin-2 C(20)-methyltransferase [Actinobacteria bacterium]|nr:precorrin-2 C(20)-methyltransferase [Actinomycetota bacterium]